MNWLARCRIVIAVIIAAGLAFAGRAAVINVSPGDSYSKIESAVAGDEVIIAPGTYTNRIYLTTKGTSNSPVTIHAQDPNNKPVWDLSATLVENAPGSYTAGDRGRGGWQISGGVFYRISGIVFTGCHTASRNSAGIRYYNGTTGLQIKDCVFRGNDNGLTGGSQESDAIVEFCEFDSNGDPLASSPTHNMYIYGGTFTLRYCYVHDSVQAENFHIRARVSMLEYNWFARGTNYEGDLMTDDDFTGLGPFTQSMLIRGNLFLQNTNPGNHGQVLVIDNDTGLTNENMSMQVMYNTYVGNGISGHGGSAAFVHLANLNGTAMSAQITNNIIFGTTQPTLMDTNTGTISGGNNWLATCVNPGPLNNSVFSAAPGFRNAGAKDFTLAAGSAAIGAASPALPGWVIKEYFQNETLAREYRLRATAHDIGAFESTTSGTGIGPYDTPPAPALNGKRAGNGLLLSWPLTAADYILNQNSNVANSNFWAKVPSPYITNSTNVSLSVATPFSNGFYRLRSP
jgi:hypothetical protein